MTALVSTAPVLAHAFGVRYDLPLPLWMFVLGGAVIVAVSFAVVEGRAVADTELAVADGTFVTGRGALSRLAGAAAALTVADIAGAVATAFLAFLVWAGLTGSQEVPENILPTWFWIVVWVVLPLLCGVIGDWTRVVNPYAWLARLADRPGLRRALLTDDEPVRWPPWLGWWPAAVVYFLAVCGELIYNQAMTRPANLALALLGYGLVSIVAGFLFGSPWLEHGEMFTVLYSTWGRLGWFRFGAPGRRRFAGGFDVPFEASVSRIAFVLLLLVSVNFDGLLATPKWTKFEGTLPWSIDPFHPGRVEAFRTVTFAVIAVVLGLLFGTFATASARAGRHRAGVRGALAGLLPSIVPIAFGYLLAHYIQYVLINGQLLAPLIGDPTGKESWPLHLPYPFNDDFEPHLHFLPTWFYWYFAVVVIVAVHVIAVFIAHRHLANRGVDRGAARRSEYPWLVAMVAYTMLSLWLLAQPLTQEKSSSKTSAVPRPPATAQVGESGMAGPPA